MNRLMSRAARSGTLAALLAVAGLSGGCAVVSIAGTVASTAVSVAGTVVSTTASVAGKVVEKTADVVTGGGDAAKK